MVRRRRESRATLGVGHARMPGLTVSGARAAARARTRSLSVRTGRRSHPCRCHCRTGRSDLVPGCSTPQVAYLTGDQLHSTPLATAFEVRQQLPGKLKALRKWVREAEVGVLEIKKRGIDIDPAVLRKQLKLDGPNSATIDCLA